MLIRRLAALGLLGLAIWSVVALWEVPLAASVAADRARIASAAAMLGGDGADARQAEALRAQDARLRAFVAAASWRLDRSSPELLSAQLQRMIEAAAARAGATVGSSRTVPVRMEKGFARVGLEVDVQATLPALQGLLLAVEAARPVVFVDRLTVTRPESGEQDELGVGLRLSVYAAGGKGGAL